MEEEEGLFALAQIFITKLDKFRRKMTESKACILDEHSKQASLAFVDIAEGEMAKANFNRVSARLRSIRTSTKKIWFLSNGTGKSNRMRGMVLLTLDETMFSFGRACAPFARKEAANSAPAPLMTSRRLVTPR